MMPPSGQSGFAGDTLWRIKLMGTLTIFGSNRKITHFRTRKSAALLGFLAFRLTPQPRETLIEMFWPEADPEAGRHNLSNALSSLRHMLEPFGVAPGSVIEADRFNVGLNPATVSSDAVEFENAISRFFDTKIPDHSSVADLEEAANHYGGPLLPGFYEDWIAPASLHFDSLYREATVRLAEHFLQTEDYEKAIHWAVQGLKSDPLDEGAALGLMSALFRAGRNSEALRAYDRFAQKMREMLATDPPKKIRDLAQVIKAEGLTPQTDVVSERMVSPLSAPIEVDERNPLNTLESEVLREDQSKLLGDEFMLRTLTRFFGREEEMSKLEKMLTVPRTRLVTITGPGGIGKTRFALEAVARATEREYARKNPFAAIFVPLAEVADPPKLFDAILKSLGGVLQETESPKDAVLRTLETHSNPILVLDNFEQLVEEGTMLVRDLLAKSARLRILVTTRRRLRIDGEQVFTLTPLSTPEETLSLELASQTPSIALFIDRAEAVFFDFQVNAKNIDAIRRLCSLLEGLPLAIELAAARVSIMSPARILAEVESKGFDFLSTSQRDRESRQHTMRSTLEWSFKLLGQAARDLLCALSLFRGGWSLEAAQAVHGGDDVQEVRLLLTDLRDSSLITVLDTEDGIRFSMLEVIRQYAAEELAKDPNSEYPRRYAHYFAELVDENARGLLYPEGLDVVRRFSLEQFNLEVSRSWADENPDDPVNSLVGMMIIRFWLAISRDHIASRLHGVASSKGGKDQSALGLLIPLGGPMEFSADLDEVSSYIQRMAELFEQRGIVGATGWNLIQLGYANLGRDLKLARSAAEKGVSLMRLADNNTALSHALNTLAVIICIQGEYENARAINLESFALLEHDQESKTYDFAIHIEGIIAFMSGDYARGEECLKLNLQFGRKNADFRSEIASLSILGRLYNESERYHESVEILEYALRISTESRGEISYLVGYISCYLALAKFRLGNPEETFTLLRSSFVLFKDTMRIQGFSMSLSVLAEVMLDRRQFVLAAQLYGASEMFRMKHGRALDRQETIWDKNFRSQLDAELGDQFDLVFTQGLQFSEQEAIELAFHSIDSQSRL